jgi:predicted metal-binding protein
MVLRGTGKWTYVYGNLHETSHLDAITEGVERYAQSGDGIVPWRERPEHFRKNCIARIPPQKD